MIPVMSLAALLLLAARVHAGPQAHAEVELSWQAPEACPAEEVVLERVQGLLGRPLAAAEEPAVRVTATVTETPAGLELSLRTQTEEGTGERRMSGQTCEVLVDAAALVVAMALDPSLGLGPEPEEPEPEPASEPPPPCVEPETRPKTEESTEPEPEPEPEPPSTSDSPLAGTVRFAGVGSLGPLPTVAPGFEVVAGLLRRHARAELGLDYYFGRQIDQEGGGGAEIQLWTVTARGCWAPAVSIVELPICGGVQVGPMRGEGRGVAVPASTRLPWVAVEAGGAVVIRGLPLVDVWIGADFVAPLTRPGFSFDDRGLVHRSAVVGGEAAAGLEVRFGPGRERR